MQKILSSVEKLARDKAVGGKKRQVGTVKSWFATSDQGRVEDLTRELIRNPNTPVVGYDGGARDNVQLTSISDAKDWLDDRGRDLWWL